MKSAFEARSATQYTLQVALKNRHSIGSFIRVNVIPKKTGVSEAARLLGVGRPALSRLLNGRSTLTPEMATRLSSAFGVDPEELLKKQAEYQQETQKTDGKRIGVRGYAAPFQSITAQQIESWANSIKARSRLSVLLRKLVHSTGRELLKVDFPGYDNSERRGSDGFIDAGAATAWIPAGRSYWEFGVNADARRKADADYAARLASVPVATRLQSTYVQVTPRNWDDCQKWEDAKQVTGDWKTVRVLDASRLEQWLEESIPAQVWFAQELALETEGVETLDDYWTQWRNAAQPALAKELFSPAIDAHSDAIESWIHREPSEPLVVASDSRGEALAFLACFFSRRLDSASADGKPPAEDIALLFRSGATLRKLSATTTRFLPISATDEVESEMARIFRQRHCIIVRPRNAVDREANIVLETLTQEAMEKALLAMGIAGSDADRLGRESANSPTIVRRRLSPIPAVRTPVWATDADAARCLVPIALIGAWHAGSALDRDIVEAIADRSYAKIEDEISRLLPSDDSPVWSQGEYRGVVSKTDAIFALSAFVSADDLKRFLDFAELVLSEPDPALQLPEDQRWMAAVYSKVRDCSAALRSGVCETLVFLAVHGDGLFGPRLGFSLEAKVTRIVHRLMTPLTLDRLLSNDRDLPRFAEAAPDEFLSIIKGDLDKEAPEVLGLLRPVGSSLTSRCLRTGLLWALETIAWAPERLSQAALILARLSRTAINDNWANKPIASLEAIFRGWMPQTRATLEQRRQAFRLIVERFPDIGWQLCMQEFGSRSRIGSFSQRPEWRSDASGAGQVVSTREHHEFARTCIDIALGWSNHSASTLGDLVERLESLSQKDIARVWAAIRNWAATASDRDKAHLRERVRRFAFTRRGRRRALPKDAIQSAGDAYEALAPSDAVLRHAWLFAKTWVEESADESEADSLDYSARSERIHQERLSAMKEILGQNGIEGAWALFDHGEAPDLIGNYVARCASRADAPLWLGRTFRSGRATSRVLDHFGVGFLNWIDPTWRTDVILETAAGGSVDEIVRVLACAPTDGTTWKLLEKWDKSVSDAYWKMASPSFFASSPDETRQMVERLLTAKRPRAAFFAAQDKWELIETSQLKELLLAAASVSEEAEGTYLLDQHDISEALDSLSTRAQVESIEVARLEFIYLDALDHTPHGIRHLEAELAKSPSLFAETVALAFIRKDGKEDPPALRNQSAEQKAQAAHRAYSLQRRAGKIPGLEKDGEVKEDSLLQWVEESRQLCADYGRPVMGDQMIGQLLSHSPGNPDGTWPCREVCNVMERIASEQMASGFHMGVSNNRGATWRARGGDQERVFAAQYRTWAEQIAFTHPFVSSVLNNVAKSYEMEAQREDIQESVSKRLRH